MDKVDKVLFGILILSFIVFVAALVIDFNDSYLEVPLGGVNNGLTPSDRVKESQIHVYEDKVVINVPNAKWAKFAPTNSMAPFLGEGSNAIQVIPGSEAEVEVGDIISYESNREDIKGIIIIHRVVEKNVDNEGVYFIAQGDNNLSPDPEKIRFSQIKRVLVGIIY